jgi:hypothetical protein
MRRGITILCSSFAQDRFSDLMTLRMALDGVLASDLDPTILHEKLMTRVTYGIARVATSTKSCLVRLTRMEPVHG